MELRQIRWACAVVLLGSVVGFGCATGSSSFDSGGFGGSAGGLPAGGGGAGAGGGTGGGTGGTSPCAEDCSAMPGIPTCYEGVCDTTKDPPVCAIQKSSPETECDDGAFCTVGDHCQDGACIPGTTQNDCGLQSDACNNVTCNEASDSCQLSPKPVGTGCTPADLCQTAGQCNSAGQCVGVPNDCLWTPVDACHVAVCDPNDGQCKPQPANQGAPCDADLCNLGGTCAADGSCTGSALKDCSYLNGVNCVSGVCEIATGNCITQQGQQGDPCAEASDTCNDGICDAQLVCQPHPKANGTPCDDFNSCTDPDTCTAGVCAGPPVANCTTYFEENFDGGCPPAGWTLNPDWQCGTPSVVGPAAAYSPPNCIGTIINGNYNLNLSWDSAYAQTPQFGLPNGSQPVVSWFMWVYTEGYTYDGANLKISIDGGATWQLVTTVSPAYTLTVGGESAWGGNLSASGWQQYTADLSAYANHQVMLRFAFRTDGSVVYPGVYIDDLQVGEAAAIQLQITTASLPTGVANTPYSAQLTKTGGSGNSQWSIVAGGVNDGWLSIDPATGVLSGTPAPANAGAVHLTIHVAEPSVPSNFADRSYDFNVLSARYFQGFDGVCPNGWTLTGEWQCGTPSVVGPATAYSPPGCLGTVLNNNYSSGDLWAANTATSPSIDLAGAVAPQVTWRMWVYTEGSSFDGANLKVSTDGGVSWQVLSTVVPAYTLTVGGESAWGGNLSGSGWQLFSADLSAYIGQQIRLRFAFQSDGSITYPGVYVDDLLVTG